MIKVSINRYKNCMLIFYFVMSLFGIVVCFSVTIISNYSYYGFIITVMSI